MNGIIMEMKKQIIDLTVNNQDHEDQLNQIQLQLNTFIQQLQWLKNENKQQKSKQNYGINDKISNNIFDFLQEKEVFKFRLVCKRYNLLVTRYLPKLKQKRQVFVLEIQQQIHQKKKNFDSYQFQIEGILLDGYLIQENNYFKKVLGIKKNLITSDKYDKKFDRQVLFCNYIRNLFDIPMINVHVEGSKEHKHIQSKDIEQAQLKNIVMQTISHPKLVQRKQLFFIDPDAVRINYKQIKEINPVQIQKPVSKILYNWIMYLEQLLSRDIFKSWRQLKLIEDQFEKNQRWIQQIDRMI